ncbi:hypothetical protein LBMAG53_04200 [Planctomycetota bacterium]|nr:hypothetical protein LBMAG53_04200 [Planctomycetota bacterium]
MDPTEYALGLMAALGAGGASAKDSVLARLGPPADGAQWPLPTLPERPGRDAVYREAPEPPRRKRGLDDPHGRLRFLHAIHHIELSAIDLAVVCCLRGAGMPATFHEEFLGLAREEAEHAELVETLLGRRGFPPGSAPIHHRLWISCRACADLGEHLVVVPRVLEARGLDVSAALLPRLAASDPEMHAVIQRIYQDEIRHVATGGRWHDQWCAQRGIDPAAHFASTVVKHFPTGAGTPFPVDVPGRLAAGFTAAQIERLVAGGSATR